MAIIVVGGQCSKVGKTSVACALIAALPGFRWTAIKVSPHQHTSAAESFYVEQSASSENDTGRYLSAGAEKAILISGNIADSLPALLAEINTAEMTLIESNHVLEFIKADILLFVLLFVGDSHQEDFKESAMRWVGRSDALLVRSNVNDQNSNDELKHDDRLPASLPRFVVGPEDWAPAKLVVFLNEKLAAL